MKCTCTLVPADELDTAGYRITQYTSESIRHLVSRDPQANSHARRATQLPQLDRHGHAGRATNRPARPMSSTRPPRPPVRSGPACRRASPTSCREGMRADAAWPGPRSVNYSMIGFRAHSTSCVRVNGAAAVAAGSARPAKRSDGDR